MLQRLRQGNSARCGCSCEQVTGYLGASLSAVHDSVAAIQGEWILQLGQTLLCELVSGINHPTICLRNGHQHS